MPSKNFVVATPTLLNLYFCFHNSFILLHPIWAIQQQETLYVGYTNPGSHLPFQIIKSNRLYRLGRTCKLKLKSRTNFFRAWTGDLMWIPTMTSTSFGLQALSYQERIQDIFWPLQMRKREDSLEKNCGDHALCFCYKRNQRLFHT